MAVFIPLPKLAVCRHTQYSMQKCEDVRDRIRTHVWCVKNKHRLIRPNYPERPQWEFKVILNPYKVLIEAPVARVL